MNYARVTETDSHLVNPTVKSPRRQVRRSYGRSPDRKRDFGDSCKYPARSRFSPRRKQDNIGSDFFFRIPFLFPLRGIMKIGMNISMLKSIIVL